VKSREPARRPAHDATVTTPDDSRSVARLPIGWEAHRRRQVQQLAVTAMVRAAYGVEADLSPLPPGPTVCPPRCGYCLGWWAA
jgi:hypothetical protein